MNRFEALSKRQQALLLATFSLLALIVLAVLAEGAVRVRQWIKHDRPIFRIERVYHTDPETHLRTPVPGRQIAGVKINSLGFRGPEIANPKPPGTIRLAFLGGSTTFSAEVSGDEATWPHLVTEALKERWPDRRFDYLNAGVSGYSVARSKRNLELRVKRLDPDIIVIYHATNDLSWNSYQEARAQGIIEERADHALSWPAKYSVLWYLAEKNLTVLRLKAQATDQKNKLQVDLEKLAQPFERELMDLVRAAQEVAAVVALVTFSTHLRPEQDPEYRLKAAETSLYYMPYMTTESLMASFAAYNRVIRKVAEDLDAVLIGGENSIPGDAVHFVDSVHFTDLGSRAMADRVVNGLIAGDHLSALILTRGGPSSDVATEHSKTE